MKKNLRKMLARPNENRFSQQPVDPAQIEPNTLRDRIYAALSSLPFVDRAEMRDRIIDNLEDSGVNISEGLLMLGIPARTNEDVTPFDLAKLIRYLRINAPIAIGSISTQIISLLSLAPTQESNASPLRRAA